MNPEQLLNVAELAMRRVRDHTAAHYTFFIQKGELCCCPSLLAPIDCPKIATITRLQLQRGLSPAEWHDLRPRLWKVWKEIKL